jgi:hypothetical protein
MFSSISKDCPGWIRSVWKQALQYAFSYRSRKNFANLLDASRQSISKESRTLVNVSNSLRMESHQSRAGGASCYRIIRKHDFFESVSGTVEWAVALHGQEAVGAYEM